MTSTLSIKWDHQGAFRRFVLDLPANGDLYGALVAKILAVQPGFNDSLAWKDNEDDLIVFTSTAELIEAVNALKNGEPLRLYTVVNGDKGSKVTIVNNAAPVPPAPVPEPHSVPIQQPAVAAEPVKDAKTVDESPVVHVNISCDGCNQSPLKGIRHKCLVCLDFDLCDKCKTEDRHAGHPMARIADPSDRSWMRHFVPFARRRMGPPPPPFCFRHVPQHVWEQVKQQQHEQQQKQKNNEENHTCQCQCNPSGEQAKQAPDHQPNTAIPNQAVKIDHQKFLHDIGTTVAQLLDSFGIDVDVLVEEGKKEKPAEEAKATPTTTEPENAASSSSAKEEVDLEKIMAQLMTAFANGDFGTMLNAFQQKQQQQ